MKLAALLNKPRANPLAQWKRISGEGEFFRAVQATLPPHPADQAGAPFQHARAQLADWRTYFDGRRADAGALAETLSNLRKAHPVGSAPAPGALQAIAGLRIPDLGWPSFWQARYGSDLLADLAACTPSTAAALWSRICDAEPHIHSRFHAAQSERDRQLAMMERMLACAERIAAVNDQGAGGVHPAAPRSSPSIEYDPGWRRVCTRSLLGGRPSSTAEVRAVLVDQRHGNEGRVVRFVLDVFAGGSGDAAHHPEDGLVTTWGAEFERAMSAAWLAARQLAARHAEVEAGDAGGEEARQRVLTFDGRWRLLSEDGSCALPRVDGPSTGAALARGWWHALLGKHPDEGVVVIASMAGDENGATGEVGEVDSATLAGKVFAMTPRGVDRDIDTVVVVGAANAREARRAASDAGPGGAIAVVELDGASASKPTLEQVVGVRSQKAAGVMAYFASLLDQPDERAPAYLGDRRLSDLYSTPDVLAVQRRPPADRARTVEAAPLTGERHEHVAREDERQREPWTRVFRTLERAVVIGRPGEGKTTLLRMTQRAIANESLAALTARSAPLSGVDVPVVVRLSDICKSGGVDRAVANVVTDAIGGGDADARTQLAQVHVLATLRTSRGWLLLDALDEAPDPAGVRMALQPWRDTPSRVVLTTRPHGYDRSVLPFRSLTEIELAPFTPRQCRGFVARWFDSTRPDASDSRALDAPRARVHALLQGNAQMASLSRNALLLTLTCAAVEANPARAAARRVEVYDWIVCDFVRRAWKENVRPESDPGVTLTLALLPQVAWLLYERDPARTLIPNHEWVSAIARAARDAGDARGTDAILADLQRAGLVVSPARGQLMFAHRTLMEFLAATFVARQPDPVGAIERYLWQRSADGAVRWQPAAAELICFLAGRLDDPNPLIQRLLELDRERPDFGRTMLVLAGRALADADEARVDAALAAACSEQLVSCWEPGYADEWWKPALAHGPGIACLVRRMASPAMHARQDAVWALGRLGDRRAATALANVLRTTDGEFIRVDAAIALGQIGDSTAIGALVEALKAAPDIFATVAQALAESGDPRCAGVLLDELSAGGGDDYRRLQTIAALGRSGDPRALTPLARLLLADRDSPVAASVCAALRQLGDVRASSALADVMTSAREVPVRIEAAVALGELGDPRGVEVLLDILERELDSGYRRSAVRGLIHTRSRDPRVVEALLVALRDDLDMKEWAIVALALAEFAGARAVAPILSGLESRPALWWYVFENATLESLARRGLIEESRIGPIVDLLMRPKESGGAADEVGPYPYRRGAAATVLAAIGGRRAADALLDAAREFHDERPLATWIAVSPDVVGPVRRLASFDRDETQYHVVTALGELKDPRAIPILLDLVTTADLPVVRRAAAESVAAIDPSRWIPPVPSARQ